MNKTVMLQACLIACLGAGISGCGSTQSENIKTKGLNAEITVEGNSSGGAKVTTSLHVGSGLGTTGVVLSDGDVLKATANGTTQVLTRHSSLLDAGSYTTTFDNMASGTVVVSLERKDDTSCPNSRVQLPEPFSITAPSGGQIFNLADTLQVNWTPAASSAGNIKIDFVTTCTSKQGGSVTRTNSFSRPDSGTAPVIVADLIPTQELDTTRQCSSDMSITRSIEGTLDPSYGEGGSIKAVQSRSVSVVLKP